MAEVAPSVTEANSLKMGQMDSQRSPDVVIAGAGVIGLALALELDRRGARVTVLERGQAMQQASVAAAGMLAAQDPHNPPALLPLARWSVQLYPEFLRRIEALSGLSVPFQTETTVQTLPDGRTLRLAERSIDPRQLAAALLAAVRSSRIVLRENAAFSHREEIARQWVAHTETGERILADKIVTTQGAWSRFPVTPRKGQMLRVQLPSSVPLSEVHRRADVYIVPRLYGPQAGSALLGATEEDAGFDTTTHREDLARLRALAAEILPTLASATDAPALEAWAGLRPGTPDGLPILGPCGHGSSEFLATGHFRNGILLAPATAVAIADCIEGRVPHIDLAAFSPERFAGPRTAADIRPPSMTSEEPLAHNRCT